MTKQDVMNMEAGREMDTLIAEVLFDCNYRRSESGEVYCMDKVPPFNYPKHGDWDYHELLHYSTNILDAWEVVEKIGGTFSLARAWKLGDSDWVGYSCYLVGGYTALADTAPLAICRAALLALMDLDDE